jgi:hypothetical protein
MIQCDHADGSLPQSSLFYLLLLGHCIYLDGTSYTIHFPVAELIEVFFKASTVWNPYTKTEINKIEAVQRRAARYVVSNQRNRSSVSISVLAVVKCDVKLYLLLDHYEDEYNVSDNSW